MKHRFLNDGVTPIPMGSTADYACLCGKRGTHAAIALHIAESAIDDAIVRLDTDDDFGEDTKAHYLPIEPRRPAPPTPAPPTFFEARTRSIAESFQDMLRTAYQAGAAAALSGETFESWYQREVLQ